jgi:hypothetical protein
MYFLETKAPGFAGDSSKAIFTLIKALSNSLRLDRYLRTQDVPQS